MPSINWLEESRDLILVRMGEIALKGLNRGRFEQQLVNNLSYRLSVLGDFSISKHDARIWIAPADPDRELDKEAALAACQDVFGLVSASPVKACPLDLDRIDACVQGLALEEAEGKENFSFKIQVKRINKSFPLSSYDLACHLGDLVLDSLPGRARVDVHRPDVTIYVELRDRAYIYSEIIPGSRGLPVGMGGRGLLLLSGGIDSPVAGYMMASRGMRLSAVYFHTPPYTSPEALDKVESLAQLLTRFTGDLDLYVVNFTEAQLAINGAVPEELLTLVMRRTMMRVGELIARKGKISALITGESLGQVASQTIEALATTDLATPLPILRPLIGMDKEAIIDLARKIGSYDTSILPYEDCCTVFVAKHPETHPRLEQVLEAEKALDLDALSQKALDETRQVKLSLRQELKDWQRAR